MPRNRHGNQYAKSKPDYSLSREPPDAGDDPIEIGMPLTKRLANHGYEQSSNKFGEPRLLPHLSLQTRILICSIKVILNPLNVSVLV